MQIKKIKDIAKKMDIIPGNMSKTELIRVIQRTEGNSDCFATMHVHDCNQMHCLWRADCKAAAIAKADIPAASSYY